MLRFVPPAGAPLEVGQILRALKRSCLSNGRVDESLSSLGAALQVQHVVGVSSGRAALWLILEGLRRLHPGRDVVAVPAYTCYTVAASVVRSGLKLYPVEVDSGSLDVDLSQLDALPQDRLLCIVTSNLFGFVNDLTSIRRIAHAKGAFVVDDAAQALGASREGYLAGTQGDVGFFSLGRGKVLATLDGGIIVTNSSEIAAAIDIEVQVLPPATVAQEARLLFQMFIYAALLEPRLYWIPNSLPFLKLGATEFAPDFAAFGLPSLARHLLPQLLERLPEINQIRRRNAAALASALAHDSRFEVPLPAPGCQPSYIRFPLVAADRGTRDRAVGLLRAAGIGASTFYPTALCDIPGIEPFMFPSDFHRRQAEDLSQRLLALPTHHLVSQADLERAAEILSRL